MKMKEKVLEEFFEISRKTAKDWIGNEVRVSEVDVCELIDLTEKLVREEYEKEILRWKKKAIEMAQRAGATDC